MQPALNYSPTFFYPLFSRSYLFTSFSFTPAEGGSPLLETASLLADRGPTAGGPPACREVIASRSRLWLKQTWSEGYNKINAYISFICDRPLLYASLCIPFSPCFLPLHSSESKLFGPIWSWCAWGVSFTVHYIAFWQGLPLLDIFSIFWQSMKVLRSTHKH